MSAGEECLLEPSVLRFFGPPLACNSTPATDPNGSFDHALPERRESRFGEIAAAWCEDARMGRSAPLAAADTESAVVVARRVDDAPWAGRAHRERPEFRESRQRSCKLVVFKYSTNMPSGTNDLLRELGLNQLEAEVYVALLPLEPMTAYRLGTLIGKPTANVYKAVEALARRGAVMIQEGETRVISAVPVEEFLRQTERSFLAKTKDLAQQLSSLEREHYDERVYRLESTSQVFERARSMLEERATKIAIVDAFPACLKALLPSIGKAIERGVVVCVQAYAPVEIPGAEIAVIGFGGNVLDAWRGEQLNVVVDGREHLLALLSEDLSSVAQAVWSHSVYLSCILHAGRLCEQTIVRLLGLPAEELGEQARGLLDQHRFFLRSDVPGHVELRSRFPRKESP